MKLNSDSFRDGQSIPGEYAFCVIDPKSHVTLSDNRNPHLAWETQFVARQPDRARPRHVLMQMRDWPKAPRVCLFEAVRPRDAGGG